MVRETGPKITPPMPNNSIPAYTEIIRYKGLIPTSFPISLGSKISLKNVTTQKRVVTIETRQGLQVACLQEIAYTNGWMTGEEVKESIKDMMKTEYGAYMARLIREDE